MYDYIVVGGGSAGCVLANRLTANPAISVLLVERGTGEARAGEIQVRPNRWDFDLWQALGNDGWGFSQMIHFAAPEGVLRGPVSELTESFLKAATECGIPVNRDFNGWTQEGAGLFHVASRPAVTAYLHSVSDRSNLTVMNDARVTAVVIDRATASGIRYTRPNGSSGEARARCEVLICAGAVNSAQLLLLSGIGPAQDLRALGISVQANLPGVGRNLQDHLKVAIGLQCAAEGVRSRSKLPEAGAFLRTSADSPAPDLEILFHRTDDVFSLSAVLQRPRSRGRVALRCSDPFAAPLVEPNYLERESDLRLVVQGLRLARRLAKARAFQRYGGVEVVPGAAVESDTDLRGYICAASQPCRQFVGTCKMGNDPDSVVDQNLCVRGVDGLRVADGSVVPAHFSGHLDAASVIIANKAADLVRRASALTPSR